MKTKDDPMNKCEFELGELKTKMKEGKFFLL